MKSIHVALLLPVLALANERKFAFSNESPTLPKGQKELEIWNTVRAGGESFTSAIDQRLEFEVGAGEHTQLALYLNASSIQTRNGSTSAWKGFSVEAKHRLTDRAADVLGSALYLELGVQPDELELEGKLLLDKQVGNLTLVSNLVAEGEWEWETEPGEDAELELEAIPLEGTLGAAWSFAPRFSAGLETKWVGELEKEASASEEEEWELGATAIFLGPTVAYGAEAWWVTASTLAQITDEKEDHQSIELRLLTGFHF